MGCRDTPQSPFTERDWVSGAVQEQDVSVSLKRSFAPDWSLGPLRFRTSSRNSPQHQNPSLKGQESTGLHAGLDTTGSIGRLCEWVGEVWS